MTCLYNLFQQIRNGDEILKVTKAIYTFHQMNPGVSEVKMTDVVDADLVSSEEWRFAIRAISITGLLEKTGRVYKRPGVDQTIFRMRKLIAAVEQYLKNYTWDHFKED